MPAKKIRVLIVDDSLLFRETLATAISQDSAIEVVGTAANAYEARDKIQDLMPDVMTLDVEMPKMNGIEFLRKLLPQFSLPVVVVSSLSDNVFDALGAGAVDFVTKPESRTPAGLQAFIQELMIKIKIASAAKVSKPVMESLKQIQIINRASYDERSVIAIGASTGGTEATLTVLKDLGTDMPGILVVQHMPPVFTRMYAERLNRTCNLEVKEAEDGDAVLPGRALIAAGDHHLKLVKDKNRYIVRSYRADKVNGHCPSVDVLFDSVAEVAGKHALGIILTGMGNDGAKGLLKMRKAGAHTIGQDQKTCVVYGMPMVAYNIGAVARQMPLEMIPEGIMDWIAYSKR